MFNLTVALKGTQTAWSLMFKEKDAADKAWSTLIDAPMAMTLQQHGGQQPLTGNRMILIEDDFGQRFHSWSDNINGAVMEDLNESKLALIERSLHQARTQVKYQQVFESDPVLKTAAMMRGPAMIQPMPGNGRG